MIVQSLRNKVGGFAELEDDEPHPAVMMAIIESKRGGAAIDDPLTPQDEQRFREMLPTIAREQSADILYSRALGACMECMMQEARTSGGSPTTSRVYIPANRAQLSDLDIMLDTQLESARESEDQEQSHEDFAPRPTMLSIAREWTGSEKKTRLRAKTDREHFARIMDLAHSKSATARESRDDHQL